MPFITVLFIYIFYLLIPLLYDKNWVQNKIVTKLSDEFNINLSNSFDISYRILPKPHYLIKDTKTTLAEIKDLAVYISQNNLFNKDSIRINEVVIEEANFSLLKDNFKTLYENSENKFSKKKIKINNSNIFFKDNLGDVISIIKDLGIDIKESSIDSLSLLIPPLRSDVQREVDVIEGNDFNLLFKKHQNLIKEIDKKHIQEFVKVSSYLKTKKNNIQLIFKSIKDTPNEQTLNQYVEILKDDIHSYNLVLFNSLNMIVSLVEDDTITFYEIHEMFDNLNIFDSKHERDVSQKLNNIGDGLKDLMYSIEEMGRNIERQMGELTYVTKQSNQLLENQLQSIDSSIKTNNLLTGINSYQTYKLRKGS